MPTSCDCRSQRQHRHRYPNQQHRRCGHHCSRRCHRAHLTQRSPDHRLCLQQPHPLCSQQTCLLPRVVSLRCDGRCLHVNSTVKLLRCVTTLEHRRWMQVGSAPGSDRLVSAGFPCLHLDADTAGALRFLLLPRFKPRRCFCKWLATLSLLRPLTFISCTIPTFNHLPRPYEMQEETIGVQIAPSGLLSAQQPRLSLQHQWHARSVDAILLSTQPELYVLVSRHPRSLVAALLAGQTWGAMPPA